MLVFFKSKFYLGSQYPTETFGIFYGELVQIFSPTPANLQSHKVKVDAHCAICRLHEETVSHILWECPFATNVWAPFRGKVQKCLAQAPDLFLLVRNLVAKLTKEELESWAITTWAI
ncbi:hypothetical protein SO802_033056 [Lithocarpus litseifolius]|uniref:Reverse transcriptase zinc-binding domain-containing protein n=1 Tax=Lithocarpus litseifolius TaxID=425828 RepID=A0AAW2BE11_9ROSI